MFKCAKTHVSGQPDKFTRHFWPFPPLSEKETCRKYFPRNQEITLNHPLPYPWKRRAYHFFSPKKKAGEKIFKIVTRLPLNHKLRRKNFEELSPVIAVISYPRLCVCVSRISRMAKENKSSFFFSFPHAVFTPEALWAGNHGSWNEISKKTSQSVFPSCRRKTAGILLVFFLFPFSLEDLSGKTAEVRKSCTFHLLIAFSDIGERKKEKKEERKCTLEQKRKKSFLLFDRSKKKSFFDEVREKGCTQFSPLQKVQKALKKGASFVVLTHSSRSGIYGRNYFPCVRGKMSERTDRRKKNTHFP